MKSKLILLAASMVFTTVSVQAGEPMQMWNCGMEDGVTEADVEAKAAAWLAAVRKVDGGRNLEAAVLWPVVVNAAGETDFLFMVKAPNFAEWGRFWDAYPDSEAAANEGGDTFCPDSVLWEFSGIE